MDIKLKSPQMKGIKGWLNSRPLSMEELRGKTVLVYFWTYSCQNSLRTIPAINRWHRRYSRKGLVVIGVHSPEFDFEKEPKNVERMVKELGICHLVALDSDRRTWDSFDNEYYPAQYLVNSDGYIAEVHFGEADMGDMEKAIQKELGVKGKLVDEPLHSYMFDQSVDTYCGFERNQGLGSGLIDVRNQGSKYVDPGQHERDVIYPEGSWSQEKECLELLKPPGAISYRFYAREVYVVMGPARKSAKAEVHVDGKKKGIKVDFPKSYAIFKSKRYADRELRMVFRGKVKIYAFSFA